MIYFTLPNFFQNVKIIDFFKVISKEKIKCFKFPVAFSYATGNFPYCYWNGGFNNNDGPGLIYSDFFDFNKNSPTALRLNCSNVYLKKEDYEDSMANTILEICENGSNSISVSDLNLYEFLKNRYPNYIYAFSKEADLKYPINEEIINVLSDTFDYIEIPYYKIFDLNFLNNLKNKNKIELTISSLCPINCPNYFNCEQQEHLSQYNYSIKNNYLSCSKRLINNNNFISLEKIIEQYLPLGFTHFSFAEMENNQNDNLLKFLIDYFIKDEYKYEILNLFLEGALYD